MGVVLELLALIAAHTAGWVEEDSKGAAIVLWIIALSCLTVGTANLCNEYAKDMYSVKICSVCGEQYTDYEYCPVDGAKLEGNDG